ncbi:porin family protein [Chitinophaga sp. 22321]|uniref:porin family protein n=1 Tax=Chitinophaga sp. 22321 TaxID=3453909 RepID=UPI003F8574DD
MKPIRIVGKTLITTFCIVIAMHVATHAQSVNAGLRFAGNVTLHGGELILQNPPNDYRAYELNGRLGFNVNAFAEINITKHFAVQPEIGYKQVQWELMDGTSPQPRPYIYTNGYWEVPLLLKYKIAGFGAYAGAQMDFLITSRAEEPSGEGLGTGIGYPDTEHDFKTKTPIYGVIGVEYTTRRPGIGFSLRYLHGFNPIFDADNSVIIAAQFKETKGRQLQFGIHWRFGKDKTRIKPAS